MNLPPVNSAPYIRKLVGKNNLLSTKFLSTVRTEIKRLCNSSEYADYLNWNINLNVHLENGNLKFLDYSKYISIFSGKVPNELI